MTTDIYIDFECLKGPPPHPALLGVLFGADGEALQQIITDERLAPAKVAKRERLVVDSVRGAVATLVNCARADDAAIVGWSYFDRDRMLEACPELESEIVARYVNALPMARRWRQKVHPNVAIEREDAHAAKHTLDKYAALTAYPGVEQLVDAAPATWIRHVIRQLKAKEGYYRRTTPEAKRDWHKLLEYNRHDLLALRHIVLKVRHELNAWHAYERTRFCFEDRDPRVKPGTTRVRQSRAICFRIGSRNRRLAAVLEKHGVKQWAFITAWNPGSNPSSREHNDAEQRRLRRVVEMRGLKALPGEGIGENAAWAPEESLMILGIGEDDAIELGRRFGQMAIVVGRRGGVPRLVACA